MVVTCEEMQTAESLLFASGGSAEPLMDKAGLGCAAAIRHTIGMPGTATLFCGRGNNGGDALVVGAWLRRWGWKVEARFSHPDAELSALSRKKLREFQAIPNGSAGNGSRILIDGLLGIGAKGPLRGALRSLADELNHSRVKEGAICFAIDIPSGLDGDTGEVYAGAAVADHTLSICQPKRGIIADGAINQVGRIHLIPLPEIPVIGVAQDISVIDPHFLQGRLKRRNFDTHKGQAGRVTIIAGSPGMTGAAVLSAMGALFGGAGLVTLFVPAQIYQIVASQAPVEVMVRPFRGDSIEEILNQQTDVFAIGPGLGAQVHENILRLTLTDERPMVLDADLLNWLAERPEGLESFPAGKRLLTPHPGELARLANVEKEGRISLTRTLARKWGVTLLHKGARTVIATPRGDGDEVSLNSTGTPEMAGGGMGDVLTGLTAALIARGMEIHDAACLGSWALGRAAELVAHGVTARRVAEKLGEALGEIKTGFC